MGVDVYFYGCVHADNTQSSDNFRGIGDLLGTKEKFVMVLLPAVIEAFESVGGETHRCRGCEIETTGIEEV